MRQHTIERKVAQQTKYEHAVPQHWRHTFRTQRRRQHLHQRDEQHNAGGKAQRKSQQAVRGLLAQHAENRTDKCSGTREYGQDQGD